MFDFLMKFDEQALVEDVMNEGFVVEETLVDEPLPICTSIPRFIRSPSSTAPSIIPFHSNTPMFHPDFSLDQNDFEMNVFGMEEEEENDLDTENSLVDKETPVLDFHQTWWIWNKQAKTWTRARGDLEKPQNGTNVWTSRCVDGEESSISQKSRSSSFNFSFPNWRFVAGLAPPLKWEFENEMAERVNVMNMDERGLDEMADYENVIKDPLFPSDCFTSMLQSKHRPFNPDAPTFHPTYRNESFEGEVIEMDGWDFKDDGDQVHFPSLPFTTRHTQFNPEAFTVHSVLPLVRL